MSYQSHPIDQQIFKCKTHAASLLLSLLLAASVLAPSVPAHAQEAPPPAPITNDEGGPVAITGEVSYTNPFFTVGTAAPMVILEDQAGFIDRNEGFILPVESQTLGQITSDFFNSPFSYSLALPIDPQGSLRDVDQDGIEETGVMVFAVAYWTNIFGDPFLEERDLFGGGWSTAYASTQVSTDVDTRREIVGGIFLVYAADDTQAFPSGFGADSRLFTADDPVVTLPQGYTIVNMDADPFTFDRSRNPIIDLIEPESAALDDFSQMSYSDAFDAMIEKLSKEYAFTEYKGLDWDALSAEFRPRFVEAEAENDKRAYLRALRDFSFAIPDGHVSGPFIVDEFRDETGGGLGMAIREIEGGRYIVNFLLEDGPAATAGIQLRGEILAIDGVPIREAIANTIAWSAPFSTDHFRQLQQMRYVLRTPVGTEQVITYRNTVNDPAANVTLTSVPERESFSFSSFARGLTGFELPLEYRLLDNGYGYAKIYSFSDNELLTIQLWERMLRTLNENSIPGLIIDMRQNSGGSGFLADQMAAYFYDEKFELGNAGFYNEEIDDFYFDPRTIDRYYLPADDLRYDGDVAVLVGPNCNSACEFFSFDMTVDERTAIVGQYPTAGLGGSIDIFLMPERERFQFTRGRAVDMNGEIHIEGKGVTPTVLVPVNEETLFAEGDPVLDAAINYLDGETAINFVDAGELAVGDTVTNLFTRSKRIRYTLAVNEGDVINLYLNGTTGALDPVLRIYDTDGALLVENDNATADTLNSAFEELTIPANLTLIVEAATIDDAETGAFELRVEAQSATLGADSAESDGPNAISTVANGADASAVAASPAPDENATTAVSDPTQDGAEVTAAEVASTQEAATQESSDGGTSNQVTQDAANAGQTTANEDPAAEVTTAEATTQEAVDPGAITEQILTGQDDAQRNEPQSELVIGTATVLTAGARLRVRETPQTDSEIAGYVANNSQHLVLGFSQDGKWIHIAIADGLDADELNTGESGWVAAEFVQLRLGQ